VCSIIVLGLILSSSLLLEKSVVTDVSSVEDIALIKATVGDQSFIKASGGVRDYETAIAMINAGANRIGASAGVAIVAAEK
jgi:deoxyribose-phosphate aldolase